VAPLTVQNGLRRRRRRRSQVGRAEEHRRIAAGPGRHAGNGRPDASAARRRLSRRHSTYRRPWSDRGSGAGRGADARQPVPRAGGRGQHGRSASFLCALRDSGSSLGFGPCDPSTLAAGSGATGEVVGCGFGRVAHRAPACRCCRDAAGCGPLAVRPGADQPRDEFHRPRHCSAADGVRRPVRWTQPASRHDVGTPHRRPRAPLERQAPEAATGKAHIGTSEHDDDGRCELHPAAESQRSTNGGSRHRQLHEFEQPDKSHGSTHHPALQQAEHASVRRVRSSRTRLIPQWLTVNDHER
jgi:hypothetical protein